MSFLLDTDTCSAYLKGNGGHFGNRVVQHFGGLHISAITLGELYTWALRSSAPPHAITVLESFLTDVLVLKLTPNVAREFGRILQLARPRIARTGHGLADRSDGHRK